MSVYSEFRDFLQRGNVVDLAVAVVLGVAFGRVVTSFVDDVLMPPLGMLLGRTDFSNLFFAMDGVSYPSQAAAKAAGAPVISYGVFINTVIQFAIISLAVFLLVKGLNRMWRREAAQVSCPYCDTMISAKAVRCPSCTTNLKAGPSITLAPEARTPATPEQG